MLRLYVTTSGARQGQVGIIHSSIESLKAQAGFDGHLSALRRLSVTIETKQGEIPLSIGDSHAVWPKHQDTGEARSFLAAMAKGLDKVPSEAKQHVSKEEWKALQLAHSKSFKVLSVDYSEADREEVQVAEGDGSAEAY